MKIVFLSIQSSDEPWVQLAEALYTKKIEHLIKIENLNIKSDKKGRSQASEKEKIESEKILEKITKDDLIILFDEIGKSLNSIEFSQLIQRSLMSGKKRLVFIIGGAFGVSEQLKQSAHHNVSLSKMVFNHHVAKIVALEQTYRALTILKNIPYHNA